MNGRCVPSCFPFIRSGQKKVGRKKGRQRKRWEDNIMEWTGLEFTKSQRVMDNREKWRRLVVKSSVVHQRPSRLRDRWNEMRIIKATICLLVWSVVTVYRWGNDDNIASFSPYKFLHVSLEKCNSPPSNLFLTSLFRKHISTLVSKHSLAHSYFYYLTSSEPWYTRMVYKNIFIEYTMNSISE